MLILSGRDRDRTDDLYRVKVALIPTELRARNQKRGLEDCKVAGGRFQHLARVARAAYQAGLSQPAAPHACIGVCTRAHRRACLQRPYACSRAGARASACARILTGVYACTTMIVCSTRSTHTHRRACWRNGALAYAQGSRGTLDVQASRTMCRGQRATSMMYFDVPARSPIMDTCTTESLSDAM